MKLTKNIEKYGDCLMKAWEQYLKIIDLFIALSGATALFMVNIMKEYGVSKLHSSLGITTISFFGISLVTLVLWRLASQHFFEYETLGSSRDAKSYFDYYKIENPVTDAFKEKKYRTLFSKIAYRFAPIVSGLSLITSWVLFVIFIAC